MSARIGEQPGRLVVPAERKVKSADQPDAGCDAQRPELEPLDEAQRALREFARRQQMIRVDRPLRNAPARPAIRCGVERQPLRHLQRFGPVTVRRAAMAFDLVGGVTRGRKQCRVIACAAQRLGARLQLICEHGESVGHACSITSSNDADAEPPYTFSRRNTNSVSS
ncbi:hypothetical protein QU41_12155 [Bradyrhizobium elkanii]|nr:hypothetical protein QU41_12155 [Bradyrhizobium elkanii]